MKSMIQERIKITPDEENLIWAEDQVGNVKRWSLRCLGKREVSFNQERSEKNEEILLTLYIKTYTARWISRYRVVLRIKTRWIELSRSYREVSTAKEP